MKPCATCSGGAAPSGKPRRQRGNAGETIAVSDR
jgi:hypothetical protein